MSESSRSAGQCLNVFWSERQALVSTRHRLALLSLSLSPQPQPRAPLLCYLSPSHRSRPLIMRCSGTMWFRPITPGTASPSPAPGRAWGPAFSPRLRVLALAATGVVLRRQLLLQSRSSSGSPSPQVRTLGGSVQNRRLPLRP